MSRTGKVKKRVLSPDPIYNSLLVTRFINRVMISGKKNVAEKQVYQAFNLIEKETKQPALEVFTQALENIEPKMEVRPRRIGGAAYQVPMLVRGDRREALAIRWLIKAAQAKSSKEYHYFFEKLAAEILAAFNKEGGAVKKKEDIHRMAEANRAFAHFRW